ncbi:unnamed protein product [Schistosoma turkestanicum]|nr:unnamed protein product [Schistosoma turkestanicum]
MLEGKLFKLFLHPSICCLSGRYGKNYATIPNLMNPIKLCHTSVKHAILTNFYTRNKPLISSFLHVKSTVNFINDLFDEFRKLIVDLHQLTYQRNKIDKLKYDVQRYKLTLDMDRLEKIIQRAMYTLKYSITTVNLCENYALDLEFDAKKSFNINVENLTLQSSVHYDIILKKIVVIILTNTTTTTTTTTTHTTTTTTTTHTTTTPTTTTTTTNTTTITTPNTTTTNTTTTTTTTTTHTTTTTPTTTTTHTTTTTPTTTTTNTTTAPTATKCS